MNLPRLKKDDYLKRDYYFWKEYREKLTMSLKDVEKIEKTPRNIYEMAKQIGTKPTARYFNITPSSVRYYIKKFEQNK